MIRIAAVVIVVELMACGKRRPAPAPGTAAEAQIRAAFPHGAAVGSPDDLHGLTVDDDGAIVLPELPDGKALALLTEAWGPPTLDLMASNGRKGKGWTSNAGTCAILDGRRIEFVSCDPHVDVAPDDDDFAAEEARVRAAFPPNAALGLPADLHGLARESQYAVLLPRMPSRKAFLVFQETWGPSAAESWQEGRHHVTIWQRDTTCVVLDQCHDVTLTRGACWGRVVVVIPCTSAMKLTDDPRWGAAP